MSPVSRVALAALFPLRYYAHLTDHPSGKPAAVQLLADESHWDGLAATG